MRGVAGDSNRVRAIQEKFPAGTDISVGFIYAVGTFSPSQPLLDNQGEQRNGSSEALLSIFGRTVTGPE
jgi:hypothetical protein